MEKMISIDARLVKCAKFLRGKKLCDIGTDHAYLPVYALQRRLSSSAIAADINEGPLDSAKKTIIKYNLTKKIEARLSDGLAKINPDEADDIVIAGMGGELIARILSDARWTKNSEKLLILQPMTFEHTLRNFLFKENYEILSEEAVIAANKVYTVICAKYTESKLAKEPLYEHIGKLNGESDEDKLYIKKIITRLTNKSKGLSGEELKENESVIEKLKEKIGENK